MGTKLSWLLDHLNLHERAEKGEICFGTVDSFLAWNLVQLGLDGLPAGIPHGVAILDVEVAAAVVHGHVVVAVAGHAAQTGVTIEAIAAGGIADDAEELLAAQVVDPGQRSRRGCNHIFPPGIIKVSEFHVLHSLLM